MSIIRQITLEDVFSDAFENIDSQYPISTDNDSVYVKDIDVANSDNGGFSGSITDYFDNLETVNSDASATNPKSIKIWFKRTLQSTSIGFGCNDLTKSFSNIVVKALGSGEVVRFTNNEYENDSTKRNSLVIDMSPQKLNGVIIEFHTADEVGLSNIIIFKSINVNARLQSVNEITGDSENILSRNGSLNVSPEYKADIPVNYYLYQAAATPTITSSTAVDDYTINVDDTTGVSAGDAITIFEGVNIFQSIVISTTGTSITFASPIDNIFTSSAILETGSWNLNVNGSVTPQIFSFRALTTSNIHIHSINCTMLDASAMDDGLFGGLTALTNGVVFRLKDGYTKNTALITNNLGFIEQGFDLTYASKAPAGQYGLRTKKVIPDVGGIIYELDATENGEFQVIIQDDLTGLDQFACTINGYITAAIV